MLPSQAPRVLQGMPVRGNLDKPCPCKGISDREMDAVSGLVHAVGAGESWHEPTTSPWCSGGKERFSERCSLWVFEPTAPKTPQILASKSAEGRNLCHLLTQVFLWHTPAAVGRAQQLRWSLATACMERARNKVSRGAWTLHVLSVLRKAPICPGTQGCKAIGPRIAASSGIHLGATSASNHIFSPLVIS